jgi:glyoxalase/bleomycin resistance protein/dioxygenase superfamily protein
VIIEFLVDDVDGVHQDLAGFVGDFVAEPTTLPWGNRSLLLRDPDGNLVSFVTPHPGRHRKVRSLTTSQPPAGASGQKPRDPQDPRPLGDPGGLATVDG